MEFRRIGKWRGGFTLAEVMVVALIGSILLTVAVPTWLRSRETARANSCRANLHRIEEAKELWAMEHPRPSTAGLNLDDLSGPEAYLRSAPVCPSGGSYEVGSLRTPAICSHGGTGYAAHVLPGTAVAAAEEPQPADLSGLIALGAFAVLACLPVGRSTIASAGRWLLEKGSFWRE
jgi:prepilin-type N-terminal cleavage/methylation domain-containing protein